MNIVKIGDPILRSRALDVSVDAIPNYSDTISNMFITMEQAQGVGLAANQIGLDINLFVMTLTENEVKNKYVCFNAKIVARSDNLNLAEEGCLSIPGVSGIVPRYDWLELMWVDENKVEHIKRFIGFDARVIQHEIDHLSGHLYIDKLSHIKKEFVIKKYNKLRRHNGNH